MGADDGLKADVIGEARRLGMSLVRTCPVGRWDEHPLQSGDYRPKNILPWAENVVVMGIPLYVPMVATTPSMVYQELYNTTNRILDDAGYRMAGYLVSQGYRAMYFPRDGYFGIDALLDDPEAAFSHVLAGYYSGMGTIGDSHNLITREFGPRVRIVSVVTDAPLEADPMLEEDLCIHCGKCLRGCPSKCFTDDGTRPYRMDMRACTEHHIQLKKERHWPCGICIKVCPVGDDMVMYRGVRPVSPEGIVHCGKKGSRSLPLAPALGTERLSGRDPGVALGTAVGTGPLRRHVSERSLEKDERGQDQTDHQDDVQNPREHLPLGRVRIGGRERHQPEHQDEQPEDRDDQSEPVPSAAFHRHRSPPSFMERRSPSRTILL